MINATTVGAAEFAIVGDDPIAGCARPAPAPSPPPRPGEAGVSIGADRPSAIVRPRSRQQQFREKEMSTSASSRSAAQPGFPTTTRHLASRSEDPTMYFAGYGWVRSSEKSLRRLPTVTSRIPMARNNWVRRGRSIRHPCEGKSSRSGCCDCPLWRCWSPSSDGAVPGGIYRGNPVGQWQVTLQL